MHRCFVPLVTSLLVVVGVASAAETNMNFSSLDQNGDGVISAQEGAYSETLTNAWQKADANEDGKIDRAEFSALETMAPAEPAMPMQPTQ